MGKAQPRLSMYLLLVHRDKILRGSFLSTKYFVAISSLYVLSLCKMQLGQTQKLAASKTALCTSLLQSYSPGITTELALDVFGKTGFSVKSSMGPELAAAVSRQSQVRCQHSLKGMKLVQGRKRGQLQPAACCVHVEQVLPCNP